MMTERRLLLGIRRPDGSVDPTPVVVSILPDGTVDSWQTLGACEPHSTTPMRALLQLPDLTLQSL